MGLAVRTAGLFCWCACSDLLLLKGVLMANHFTPEELAEELGTETREVIQLCVKEGIPIYKGKVDRSLLMVVMKAKGIKLPKTTVASI
jgi:hypothetical protein